jgi:hypothetical protein
MAPPYDALPSWYGAPNYKGGGGISENSGSSSLTAVSHHVCDAIPPLPSMPSMPSINLAAPKITDFTVDEG